MNQLLRAVPYLVCAVLLAAASLDLNGYGAGRYQAGIEQCQDAHKRVPQSHRRQRLAFPVFGILPPGEYPAARSRAGGQ